MKSLFPKIRKNCHGFTLTEVMIGIMILTVAVVSATNLVVGLIRSNRAMVLNLQASYLAQEGIEAVRNIRDTNWLNNLDWRNHNEDFYELKDGEYAVYLNENGWRNSRDDKSLSPSSSNPWKFRQVNPNDINEGKICISGSSAKFYSDCAGSMQSTPFYRKVKISKYCSNSTDLCKDSILVTSTVTFASSGSKGQVQLQEVLTNWKGGAL